MKMQKKLVLERIYPTQWIAPELYKTGDEIEIELGAYETAIFNVYELSEATKPLLSNVVFEEKTNNENNCELTILRKTGNTQVLNPSFVKKIRMGEIDLDLQDLSFTMPDEKEFVTEVQLTAQKSMGRESINNLKYILNTNTRETAIAILMTPEDESKTVQIPKLKVFYKTQALPISLNGSRISEKTKYPVGEKIWYTFPIPKGKNELKLIFEGDSWKGQMEMYALGKQKMDAVHVNTETNNAIKLQTKPPKPWNKYDIGKVEKVITESITIE